MKNNGTPSAAVIKSPAVLHSTAPQVLLADDFVVFVMLSTILDYCYLADSFKYLLRTSYEVFRTQHQETTILITGNSCYVYDQEEAHMEDNRRGGVKSAWIFRAVDSLTGWSNELPSLPSLTSALLYFSDMYDK